jgi:hypothetical protein
MQNGIDDYLFFPIILADLHLLANFCLSSEKKNRQEFVSNSEIILFTLQKKLNTDLSMHPSIFMRFRVWHIVKYVRTSMWKGCLI